MCYFIFLFTIVVYNLVLHHFCVCTNVCKCVRTRGNREGYVSAGVYRVSLHYYYERSKASFCVHCCFVITFHVNLKIFSEDNINIYAMKRVKLVNYNKKVNIAKGKNEQLKMRSEREREREIGRERERESDGMCINHRDMIWEEKKECISTLITKSNCKS